MMRSDTIKKGFERAPHRSLLRATGQIRERGDFDKPFVAICNSYVDIIPGHAHLQEFGRVVKEVVRAAGGSDLGVRGGWCARVWRDRRRSSGGAGDRRLSDLRKL